MKLAAYRRLDWRDGFDVCQCCSCGGTVSDPVRFCTWCGVEWTSCIVDTPQAARERKPGRGETWRRKQEYEYGVHPATFLVQARCTMFDRDGYMGEWYTRTATSSPKTALRALRCEREREEKDVVLRIICEKEAA